MSYALAAGGLFYAMPAKDARGGTNALWDYTNAEGYHSTEPEYTTYRKMVKERGLVALVYMPPNSMIIMGGYFQSQMVHGTLSTHDVRPPFNYVGTGN
jgi:hypothetical protein